MPPNALVSLLTHSQDVAELLLCHLPLASLAALQATCRSLREVASPSTWQQAAQREFSPQHPVQRAASVPGYLRRQHTAATNMEARRFQLREHHTAEGVVSDDLAMHATLERRKGCIALHVTALESGATLHRTALPPGLEHVCQPPALLWSHDGRTVVIRFGDEWTLRPDQYTADSVTLGTAGLVFVQLPGCSCQVVELPCQEPLIEAGIVLSCSECSPCTQCLLVLHADAEQQLVVSVYSTSAVLVASAAIPELDPPYPEEDLDLCTLEWSPDGQWVAVHVDRACWVCLWQPFASAALQCIELGREIDMLEHGSVCWSPCSTLLLIYFDKNACALCDLGGKLMQQHLNAGQLDVVWGQAGLAILSMAQGTSGLQKLCHHRVVDGQLQHAFAVYNMGVRLLKAVVCSPNGPHCACMTQEVRLEGRGASLQEPRLEVVSPVVGPLILQPLPPLRGTRTRSVKWAKDYLVGWSDDGLAAFCCDSLGTCHVHLTFE